MNQVTDNMETEYPAFASKFTKDAAMARQNLPQDVQSEFFRIVDSITEDPDMKTHPGRVQKLSRDGSVCLYKNPMPNLELTYEIDRDREIIYFSHISAPTFDLVKPLFISYSHNDADWLEKLKKYLLPLERDDRIKLWDDNEIKAGDKWKQEIDKSLNEAKAAVLLVTQDFLASTFISETELPELLSGAHERGVTILWIAVEHSTYKDTQLVDFQAVNDPDQPLASLQEQEQKKVLVDIYEQIKTAIR
jgi:hypothetical protein